jgi:hypothetical protein
MTEKILIIKQSGEQQPFSEDKLILSMLNAGAPEEIAREVLSEIKPMLYEGITTRLIYRNAFRMLRKKMRSVAARYSLKNAIMELGPSGFPFEKFVGEIFRKQGFRVQTGQIVRGNCVQHEMDVIAENKRLTVMAECKYHNDQSKINGVQVPLYVNSRMHDIKKAWDTLPENQERSFQGWIVTNTRFSSDAEEYGTCAGLHLLSWSFPEKDNLRQLIEKYALFPVTALTTLTKKQKQFLLEHDVILADQLLQNPDLLSGIDVTANKTIDIISEASTLSALGRVL